MKYDVFISYRRKTGKNYARIIKPELENRHIKVFLDYDELKDGKFDKRIMDAISEAPIFLILLTEGCLDCCVNDDDWVRKEIMYAYEHHKHIIPVEVDKSFRPIPDYIPNDIKSIVGQHQFSQVDTETLFQASIDELVKSRIKPYIKIKSRIKPYIKKREQLGRLHKISRIFFTIIVVGVSIGLISMLIEHNHNHLNPFHGLVVVSLAVAIIGTIWGKDWHIWPFT